MSLAETHQILLAVARTGSITQAAAALGLNYSTVRRRLAQVEAQLGVALFERGPGGQQSTPAGREYLAAASEADRLLTEAKRRVASHDPRVGGELRVTTTQAFFSHYLLNLLPAFTAQHPQIRLSFSFGNAFRDLSRREADVALRFSTSPGDALVGVRLFAVMFAHYRHVSLRDASAPGWIGWAEDSPTDRWLQSGPMPTAPITTFAADETAQLALLRAGRGMVWIPCYLCDGAPELERVPGSTPFEQIELWALTHPDLRDTPRVRAFMDFFLPRLRADADLFAGTRR